MYGVQANGTITSLPGALTTFTSTVATDPTAQYVTNILQGRTVTTTTGTNSGTNGVILSNTLTTITVGSWSSGTPSSGAAYTVTGSNAYTTASYLPVTGCTIEPDPGLFSPAVMMAQRDKNIFALYGQYKFSGGVDAPIFPTNGMHFLAGNIGPDVNQYGSLPTTTCFGFVTATQVAGANVLTVNFAGATANSTFATGQTYSIGALGVGQYGSNATTYTSSANTTFGATSAVDNTIVIPWTTNQWAGRVVTAATGQAATIISNTATTLTTSAWWSPTVASTPVSGTVFTIQANFTSQANNSSFVITPNQISTVVAGGGHAAVITNVITAGVNFGGIPQAIAIASYTSSGAATTYTATTISETAATAAVTINSLVGKVITSGVISGVVSANSAAAVGGVLTISVANGWFVATTGATSVPPASNAVYVVSSNNIIQAVSTPYFHSFQQSNSVLPSYTIEKSLGGGDTLHNAESELYIGCRFGKYTMKLGATNTEAQFTADVVARNGTVLASPTTPSYTNENPFVFSEATVAIFGTNANQAEDIEVDIDNGLKQTYTFDQTHQLTYNTPVVRNITGKTTVVHDNLDDATYGYFTFLIVNQTQGSLQFTLAHPASGGFLPGLTPSEQVQITLSAINLSKYADDLKLEDVIMTSLDFTAFLNLAASPPTTISAVVANQQAFAY
jgi:hypothetical protein